jgi:hypothetical protein
MRYFLIAAYEAKFICKIAGLLKGGAFVWGYAGILL